MNQTEHLTSEQFAGYLDHHLDGSARDLVEQHLDECGECRAELRYSARLVDSWTPGAITPTQQGARRTRRRWLPLALSGTLAAAAALIVVTGPHLLKDPNRPIPMRAMRASDFGEGRTRLEPIAPSPDSIVDARSLSLMWHHSDASLYTVTVLTESGDPLYTVDTGDTSIVLPDSLKLSAGRNYFWRVEGVASGIVSTTGATWLRIRR